MCVCVCVLCFSWVAYEGPQCTGHMYVLEEGDYQTPEAIGCLGPDFTIGSIQTLGHVRTDCLCVCPFHSRALVGMLSVEQVSGDK